jgi:small GTP-binding protein
MSTAKLKLALLGEGGVGKTTLAMTFKEEKFTDSPMTIAVQYHVKKIEIDGRSALLQIWDLGGQDQFKNMGLFGAYLDGTQAAAICFDLTDLDTLDALPSWLELLPHDTSCILVGLKADLIAKTFDPTEIELFMKQHSFKRFYPTSSKDIKSVTDVFKELTASALKRN